MQWTHWHPHNSSAARLIKWLTKSTATVRIYRVAQEIVEHLCLTLKYAQFYFVYTPCLRSTVNRLNIHEFFCNFADNIVTRPKYFLCNTIHDVFKNTFTSNKNFLHCTLTNLQKKIKAIIYIRLRHSPLSGAAPWWVSIHCDVKSVLPLGE